MTQKWLVFRDGTPASTIKWHMDRNDDACGYYTGVPPKWQQRAADEQWTYPHFEYEDVPTSDGSSK